MGGIMSTQKLMCLNASIIMMLGFIGGLMIGLADQGVASGPHPGWSLAHMEGITNSLVVFAVAPCLNYLNLTMGRIRLVGWCLILMGYCNVTFGFIRAITGAHGYTFDTSFWNNVMTLAGMLGVPLGGVAFCVIAYGALKRDPV